MDAVTLTELRAALERRAAEAEAVGATAPLAGVYRQVLGELTKLNGGNGPSPAPAESERWLTVDDVAGRLQVSRRFVYAHQGQLGGKALSKRALRFPETAITRYLTRRP